MIIYCIVAFICCHMCAKNHLTITLNNHPIGVIPSKDLLNILDLEKKQLLNKDVREYILRESFLYEALHMIPYAKCILRFIPLMFQITRHILALECEPRYLSTTWDFCRYINLKSPFREIASNLKFTLPDGIKVWITFRNFYHPDGFIIGDRSCAYVSSIEPINTKSFMPLFQTQAHYHQYMISRMLCGISPESEKLHDAILLAHTVKDCMVWIKGPHYNEYRFFSGTTYIHPKINNNLSFGEGIMKPKDLDKHPGYILFNASITCLIQKLFNIPAERWGNIISKCPKARAIDPRMFINARSAHFIICIKHILQNPDHWLRNELSAYLKDREYLTENHSFYDTKLFPELDGLAQEILSKLDQACAKPKRLNKN